MPKLYVIMEGLVSVATQGIPMVLLMKTYPEDRDALGRPLMPHLPRVTFRTAEEIRVVSLNGEDIRFTPVPAGVVRSLDLKRLPTFSQILNPQSNGNRSRNAAQPVTVRSGCIGGDPGHACPIPGGQNPRLAGRVVIDQGALTSIQVDTVGNPIKTSTTRFKFQFLDDGNRTAFDMRCDNALLLTIDTGTQAAQLQVGQQTYPLSNASMAEKKACGTILDPDENCVIVRVSDMVDPAMMNMMMMEDGADVHFPIFFDLLEGYTGSKVLPTVIDEPGDPPLSRCIPPVMA